MIAHLDMDAFFAKCEELRNPELEDSPLVICVYTRDKTSGAVSTSNYNARESGISSGMPLSEARKRASDETVFLPVDHEYYREKSREVISVLRSYTKEIEKTSVDEAYFRLEKDVESKVREIRSRIESLGLTASVGVAPNKLLAKLASEENKPDGMKIVEKTEIGEFLEGRTVGELHGIGSKTEKELEKFGIKNVEELKEANNTFLVEKFGKSKAASLKQKSRGEGSTDLGSDNRKQITRIKTMARNSLEKGYIMKELESVAEDLYTRSDSRDIAFRKVKLVAIDVELDQMTRSKKINTSDSRKRIMKHSKELLDRVIRVKDTEIRRIGISLSDFVDKGKQRKLESF